MRALTIHQPFAALIVAGAKPYEFRGWRPNTAMIGQRVVIHASARRISPRAASEMFLAVRDQALSSIIEASLDPRFALPILARAWTPHDEPLPLGVGLGTVIIGAPRPAPEVAEAPGYPLADGEAELWAWPMLDIERWSTPIPAHGQQGLWHWHAHPG